MSRILSHITHPLEWAAYYWRCLVNVKRGLYWAYFRWFIRNAPTEELEWLREKCAAQGERRNLTFTAVQWELARRERNSRNP